jgi:thioredoxin reductase (NADPH)
LDIVQPCPNAERVIVTHGPGGFTGEFAVISGQRYLLRGRVAEAGEFLQISAEAARSVVAKDAELSEIFMRAFILRRLTLIAQGAGNAILLGSRHSPGTLVLREFLGRNGHPYVYVDLDTDQDRRSCWIISPSSPRKFPSSSATDAVCCAIRRSPSWPTVWD